MSKIIKGGPLTKVYAHGKKKKRESKNENEMSQKINKLESNMENIKRQFNDFREIGNE